MTSGKSQKAKQDLEAGEEKKPKPLKKDSSLNHSGTSSGTKSNRGQQGIPTHPHTKGATPLRGILKPIPTLPYPNKAVPLGEIPSPADSPEGKGKGKGALPPSLPPQARAFPQK